MTAYYCGPRLTKLNQAGKIHDLHQVCCISGSVVEFGLDLELGPELDLGLNFKVRIRFYYIMENYTLHKSVMSTCFGDIYYKTLIHICRSEGVNPQILQYASVNHA